MPKFAVVLLLSSLSFLSGCATAFAVVDTAASVAVRAVGAATDVAIDTAKTTAKVTSKVVSKAVDVVLP